MKKNVYKFMFYEEKNAEDFIEKINGETSATAMHPFKGNQVGLDKKTVLVKGSNSFIYDMNLREICVEACNALGGTYVSWQTKNGRVDFQTLSFFAIERFGKMKDLIKEKNKISRTVQNPAVKIKKIPQNYLLLQKK